MDFSGIFGRLACSHGYHKWQVQNPADTELLRHKGGLLLGTVEIGQQSCARCETSREAFKAASLLSFCTDDTGWREMTPQIKAVIETNYCKLTND